MEQSLYSHTCAKCGHKEFSDGEVHMSGGFWKKIFNIQNRKFTTVTCTMCGYTEFYDTNSSKLGTNILDFFMG